MKAVVAQRIQQVDPIWALDPEWLIFAEGEVLDRICLMSEGHRRILTQLIQLFLERSVGLLIQVKAVQRALTEMRDTYRQTVESNQWRLLVEVSKTKRCGNDQIELPSPNIRIRPLGIMDRFRLSILQYD